MKHGAFDAIPLWGVFVLTAALVLLAIEIGYRSGSRRRVHASNEQAGPVGVMAGATLALLAFMLGFTFSFAAGRVDARRTALMNEANAIGTAYLRADMLPEPHRSEIRQLLRDDVATQIEAAAGTTELESAMGRVDAIHAKLWEHTTALGRDNPNSIVAGIFIQSLNEAIDQYAVRLMTVRTRVARPIWIVLYTLTFLALVAMGYQIALTGTSRSPAVTFVALSFAIVICLVADLDRPHEGRLRVSQQPLLDLQATMQAGAAE
jgi:hypothetical protein